jgi:hypothetical protein
VDNDQFQPGAESADSGGAADLDSLVAQVDASLHGQDEGSPEPAPTPDQIADEPTEQVAAPLATDEAADDSEPTVEAQDTTPAEPAKPTREQELERELSRVQAQREREREEQRAAQQRAAWDATWQNGLAQFEAMRESIFEEAENAYDKDAYLRTHLGQYDALKTQWLNEFNANRMAAERQDTHVHKARNYANYLREEHNFSKQEADHIVGYALKYPNHVTAEVQRMLAARQASTAALSAKDKRIRELELQIAAQKLSGAAAAPGSGRRSGPRKTESIDDYLADLGIN